MARTCDLSAPNAALSQLSYIPIHGAVGGNQTRDLADTNGVFYQLNYDGVDARLTLISEWILRLHCGARDDTYHARRFHISVGLVHGASEGT